MFDMKVVYRIATVLLVLFSMVLGGSGNSDYGNTLIVMAISLLGLTLIEIIPDNKSDG
jgi:hypothetical protein